MKKYFWFLAIVCVGLSVIKCRKSPDNIILAYQNAHNIHDITQALTYYTDDIEFEIVGSWIKKGKTEIRKLEEWDASVGGKLVFHNLNISGNVITCQGKEINEWFKLTDIDTIYYTEIKFTLQNQKISRIKAQLDSTSFQKINNTLGSIINWASIQKPQIMSILMPNNKFEYSSENGEIWINLLKDWRMAIAE